MCAALRCSAHHCLLRRALRPCVPVGSNASSSPWLGIGIGIGRGIGRGRGLGLGFKFGFGFGFGFRFRLGLRLGEGEGVLGGAWYAMKKFMMRSTKKKRLTRRLMMNLKKD